MSADEEYLIREMAMRCRTSAYRDRIQQGILLRSARNEYEKVRIRRIIMEARASWLAYLTRLQRDWGSKVSRRPKRGRHHDSWATREAYVRVNREYRDFMPYANKVRAA